MSEKRDDEHWRWVGPAVRRLAVRNFRCIATCDVALQPLTVVVGGNATGKSALLDALAFVGDAVRTSLREATWRRGGVEAIRRRGVGRSPNLLFDLEARLPSWHLARYRFELAGRAGTGFEVRFERAEIRDDEGTLIASFAREGGVVQTSIDGPPPPDPDALYLTRAAGLAPFRALYDTLATTVVYDFDDRALRRPSGADDGHVLRADGANLPSVVARLGRERPDDLARIATVLGAVAPGIVGVERAAAGHADALLFRRLVAGSTHPWRFFAEEVGAGTLRALAILVAAFQDAERSGRVALAAIESPETSLHPTAIAGLAEALRHAAQRTQLVLTSHSPELADALLPGRDALLLTSVEDGGAEIGGVDLLALRADGESAGTRLRRGDLTAHRAPPPRENQLDLFG